MGFLRNGRVLLLGGAAVALIGGLAVAWVLMSRSHASTEPPPAAPGAGLVVVTGRDDDKKLDPKRPLRCFVGGQFVGELPLEVCAQRNGVATGALDVGLDQSGALAASNGAGAAITPLPPEPPLSQPLAEASPAANASNDVLAPGESAPEDLCWRYGVGGWTQTSAAATLSACVQSVYGSRCPATGQAFYGRWGGQTLRLQDGRVEISADNNNFQSLIDAWPACQVHAAVNAARPPPTRTIGSHP
jgi:hypothetical protein